MSNIKTSPHGTSLFTKNTILSITSAHKLLSSRHYFPLAKDCPSSKGSTLAIPLPSLPSTHTTTILTELLLTFTGTIATAYKLVFKTSNLSFKTWFLDPALPLGFLCDSGKRPKISLCHEEPGWTDHLHSSFPLSPEDLALSLSSAEPSTMLCTEMIPKSYSVLI